MHPLHAPYTTPVKGLLYLTMWKRISQRNYLLLLASHLFKLKIKCRKATSKIIGYILNTQVYSQLNSTQFCMVEHKREFYSQYYVNKTLLLFKNVLETMPEDFCFQTDKLLKDLEDNIMKNIFILLDWAWGQD